MAYFLASRTIFKTSAKKVDVDCIRFLKMCLLKVWNKLFRWFDIDVQYFLSFFLFLITALVYIHWHSVIRIIWFENDRVVILKMKKNAIATRLFITR